MLTVKNLSFAYDTQRVRRQVLYDINFHIKENENVALIGANGVGKSTLLKILVGLLDQYEGDITLAGLIFEKKNAKRWSEIREKLGYIFQDSDNQLFMNSIYEDVAFGPRNYGFPEEEVNRRTMEALEQVHIQHLKDRSPHHLSGGEKKLASIATVLSMGAEMILFDEPSVALDPKNRRHLIEVMKVLPQSKIIASHDLDFVRNTCERTMLMWNGQIVAYGKTENILDDKALLEKYELI